MSDDNDAYVTSRVAPAARTAGTRLRLAGSRWDSSWWTVPWRSQPAPYTPPAWPLGPPPAAFHVAGARRRGDTSGDTRPVWTFKVKADKAGKTIEVDDAALELLVTQGHSLAFGARFLKRVVDERIKLPISARWRDGSHFVVRVERGELGVNVMSRDEPRRCRGGSADR
jgi:C-terminal, D2-small domain, of ClpB protein